MMFEFLVGWTIAETVVLIVLRLWRPAVVLWALLGHPPLLVYLAAVVIALGWAWRVFDSVRYRMEVRA